MLIKLKDSARIAVMLGLVTVACLAIAFANGGKQAQAAGGTYVFANLNASPEVTCVAGQCFTDVPASNGFFANVNNLFLDGIIGGFACGGPGEPCDDQNRPYYRPGNNVTRQQMAKFADLGRRNIAAAIGISLNMTNTTGPSLELFNTTSDSLRVRNSSSQDGIDSRCISAGAQCFAFEGFVESGNRPGDFRGGQGIFVDSEDATHPGAEIRSFGANAYGAEVISTVFRGLLVDSSSGAFGLVVGENGNGFGANIFGDVTINGDLNVGSCSGCLQASIIQNVGTENLEAGDVVTIVGSAVTSDNSPVITVKKAADANDTGVAGIIGQAMYVPDAGTRAAYVAEQQTIDAARAERKQAQAEANASGVKFNPDSVNVPLATITDAQGTMHVDRNTTSIAPDGYAQVLIGGTYSGVKVDASFGAIKPGDLLVSSPNAGFAMKANSQSTFGTVIGKAVGSLDSGTGTIAVLITLK